MDTDDRIDPFAAIAAITAWLDSSNPPSDRESAMRIMKLSEEIGEVVGAYIGMVGQNPRKGVTHTLDDVLNELADVAGTALCAIQYFTRDATATRGIVMSSLARVMDRSGIVIGGSPDAQG